MQKSHYSGYRQGDWGCGRTDKSRHDTVIASVAIGASEPSPIFAAHGADWQLSINATQTGLTACGPFRLGRPCTPRMVPKTCEQRRLIAAEVGSPLRVLASIGRAKPRYASSAVRSAMANAGGSSPCPAPLLHWR